MNTCFFLACLAVCLLADSTFARRQSKMSKIWKKQVRSRKGTGSFSIRNADGGNSVQSPIKCTQEGFFPTSGSCQKFHRCVETVVGPKSSFQIFYFKCPLGSVFDDNIDVCTHPPGSNMNCYGSMGSPSEGTSSGSTGGSSSGPSDGTSSGPMDGSNGSDKPPTTVEVPENSFVLTCRKVDKNTQPQYFAHPEYCNYYYYCIQNEIWSIKIHTCPGNLIYDEKTMHCVPSDKAVDPNCKMGPHPQPVTIESEGTGEGTTQVDENVPDTMEPSTPVDEPSEPVDSVVPGDENPSEPVDEGVPVDVVPGDENPSEPVDEGVPVDENPSEPVDEGVPVDENPSEPVDGGVPVDENPSEPVDQGVPVDENPSEPVNEGVPVEEGIPVDVVPGDETPSEPVDEGAPVDENPTEPADGVVPVEEIPPETIDIVVPVDEIVSGDNTPSEPVDEVVPVEEIPPETVDVVVPVDEIISGSDGNNPSEPIGEVIPEEETPSETVDVVIPEEEILPETVDIVVPIDEVISGDENPLNSADSVAAVETPPDSMDSNPAVEDSNTDVFLDPETKRIKNKNKNWKVHPSSIMDCSRGPGLYPFKSDCVRFYRCAPIPNDASTLVGLLYKCPYNYVYDPVKSWCVWETPGKTCSRRHKPPKNIDVETATKIYPRDFSLFFNID